ncbi:MAG: NIF3 (NGG1p interacting factor 3) [candidate division WS2 bacterium ADurb.Bin280]|uniref:NIF3 (NGG1p interacting factor 3) n=1 Tax=candidate division WS2 bacterium ADurb.Bin280 TaxID=1852829 RepID=A0A1V5SBP6_9BACT|nr:MAG: NIF3 (NGG1p interacting factor 3) [candidate division WS2 bacterium ADurb.Bin280]
MTVKEIFDLAIQTGIKNDPRGADEIKRLLEESKKDFDDLSKSEKEEFDQQKLTNPYSDSRFLCGDQRKKVKRVLVGIDIGTEEVLLARELERMGKPIDLIIAHHPEGRALADLHEVMDLQTSVLSRAGIPENIAEGIIREQLEDVSRKISPANHYKSVMAAELLGVSMINIHTPADNCVWRFVDNLLEKKNPRKISDIINVLKTIPEYKEAVMLGSGPKIFSGNEKNRCGKIVVSGMTGGTHGKGSEKIYERMGHYGIGTVIAMHVGEEDRNEAIKHYVNIVVAGHIASDSLGLNIILDSLEKKGIEIVACSGFIRNSRAK